MPVYYSKALRDLVDYLLTVAQDSRPTIEQVLRQPIVRAELERIVSEFIPLTFNYVTAVTAHKVLEKIVVIQCSLAKWSDYGLPMIDKSLLRVANTEDTEFLCRLNLMLSNKAYNTKKKRDKVESNTKDMSMLKVNHKELE